MFDKIRNIFSTKHRDEQLEKKLEELRSKTPVPVFWLFGKTQSGKTSIIKYLTGAEEAEIGEGFKPCTRFSRRYDFPTEEAPLLSFVDTRGIDEPGYEPAEDIERFNDLAHVIVVTVKAMDHAQENIERHLKVVHESRRDRPIVLAATCLHEAYPQQQHQLPYEAMRWDDVAESRVSGQESKPVDGAPQEVSGQGTDLNQTGNPAATSIPETPQSANEQNAQQKFPIPDRLKDSLIEQRRRFKGLFDYFVPIDLTRPEEGFNEPNYGGERLKEVLLESLPAAYRQTLITLDAATGELSDLYARHALPHIVGYSSLAATAGAIPVPFLDLFIIPGIQTRMIYHLAQFYGQPLTGERFLELASALGMGMIVRQATRELVKFIPYVGSVAGAAVAGAATFALGKAFCYYYSAVHRGQVPQPEDLKKYYHEQLAKAQEAWKKKQVPVQE